MSGTDAHPDNPVLLACRELGRAMDLFDEAACARLDLGRSDLRALNLLEHGPVGASALADQLGLTRSAVTALIDRLVHAGFVARAAVPGDRRATAIELMPATWQAFAEIYRPSGDASRRPSPRLSEPERHALLGARSMQRPSTRRAGSSDARRTQTGRLPVRVRPLGRRCGGGQLEEAAHETAGDLRVGVRQGHSLLGEPTDESFPRQHRQDHDPATSAGFHEQHPGHEPQMSQQRRQTHADDDRPQPRHRGSPHY